MVDSKYFKLTSGKGLVNDKESMNINNLKKAFKKYKEYYEKEVFTYLKDPSKLEDLKIKI